MTDKERQIDEIEALKWIYPQELTMVSEWPAAGYFKISPLVEKELNVNIQTTSSGISEERTIKVKYLPPLELYFKCPEDYPSTSQPMFMISCGWLPAAKLTQICHQFDKLWDECFHTEVLFSWVSFLKEDCCRFLQIYELNITLDVDKIDENSANSMLNELMAKRKDIKLKELRNKRNRKEFENVSPRPKTRITKSANFRETRIRGLETFKYETPKDLEIKDVKETYISANENNGCSRSKSIEDVTETRTMSKADHILKAMRVYGRRYKIRSTDFDNRVVPNFSEITDIVNVITDYNDRCLDLEFRCQYHNCNICFEIKLGSACVCIKPCRHAFCKECISTYLNVRIIESQVQNLCCLDPDCDTLLSAQQIKQNVDDATFEKYLKFSRKALVQNDSNLIYCPRKFCQGIARSCDKGRNLSHCEQCDFYFCVFCMRSYHGVEKCKLKSDEIMKVIAEYQTAGPVRKAELEKRFTKHQLVKWVEDDLTQKLLQKSTKPCPNCGALIEKNHGCNKMICSNCNVPFCWLCNICLSQTHPYAHYQNKGSPCYERLFPEAYEEDGDDDFILFDDVDDNLDALELYYLDEDFVYFSDSD